MKTYFLAIIIEDWKDGSIAPIAFIGDAETAEMLEGEGKAAYDWLITQANHKLFDNLPADYILIHQRECYQLFD